MGLKRDNSRGSFFDGVTRATERFYADVLQNLRAWKAAPPKLTKQLEHEEKAEEVAELIGVQREQVADESLRPPAGGQEGDEPRDANAHREA